MISIKKYLDDSSVTLLATTLAAYRNVLLTFASSALRAVPGVSQELHDSLARVENSLKTASLQNDVQKAAAEVKCYLDKWAMEAESQSESTVKEVKKLLLALASTAESAYDHDAKSAARLNEITQSLETIGRLDDIVRIKGAVFSSANQLAQCVRDITAASNESTRQFRKQLSHYERQLDESQQRGMLDSLTGILNRRGINQILERRIQLNSPFCVVMIDLDDFKTINDTLGHSAGDQLLKQFSIELKAATRETDHMGRWGGDEFMLILDCDLEQATAKLAGMDRWVFGDYVLNRGDGDHVVSVSASYGVSQRQDGDTLETMLARADEAMYFHKSRTHPRMRM